MDKIRVFEAFSGYGTTTLSLREFDIPYEVVGVSEIDVDAIIGYGSLRFDEDDLDALAEGISIEEMRKELIEKNIGYNYRTKTSCIPKMRKKRLISLYKFNKAINNYGDFNLLKPEDIPVFDYLSYTLPLEFISEENPMQDDIMEKCQNLIKYHKPKYLLMENVKTFSNVNYEDILYYWWKFLSTFGYFNNIHLLNAKDFNVPQSRNRLFMISTFGKKNHKLDNIPKYPLKILLKDLLEDNVGDKYNLKRTQDFFIKSSLKMEEKGNQYIFEPHIRKNAEIAKIITTKAGNRMEDNYILDIDINLTKLSFRKKNLDIIKEYFGDKRPKIRRLTPKECLRLMGLSDFDSNRLLNSGISDLNLYKLAGNGTVKQCLDEIHKILFEKYIDN